MSEIRVDNITDEAGTGRPDFSNGIKTSNINGGPIGRRNAIINGNFGVNQRGVSGTVSLSAGEYGHDRWKAGASGATYTFSTSGGVTTIDISAGSLIQVVEDVNVVTDTYVLSWTGTAQGKIGSGSFGDSGVTESVTGGSNLNIEFGTGTVSKVQLEVGDTATEFEHRSIGEELALCQRYYQNIGKYGNSSFPIGAGYFFDSGRGSGAFFIPLSCPMRISQPSISTATDFFEIRGGNTGSNDDFEIDDGFQVEGGGDIGVLSLRTFTTSSLPITEGNSVSLANNRASNFLQVDAEL